MLDQGSQSSRGVSATKSVVGLVGIGVEGGEGGGAVNWLAVAGISVDPVLEQRVHTYPTYYVNKWRVTNPKSRDIRTIEEPHLLSRRYVDKWTWHCEAKTNNNKL